MKRFEVVYRPEAIADIDSVFLYILEASRNASVAAAYTDRVLERCERIGDAPRGGVAREDLGPGIRMVPFEKSAVILYRTEGETVVVVNIFYGRRDYEAIMIRTAKNH
ncbi:type II toxin-antitoxin system RelE/ParE family toxin [Sinorhizobium meliloti]|uniref:type II toxin-antitoxin system RelE/ParE family toxin n=1 Tax=Rhizobium meliloti TaxID=382 RepID=UPI000310C6C4|nr:type II toxin-antitoxin system RelE/ParE family toxin [Sinorhizobium meliloti]MDE3759799.1 type II toxin-antitoxin system RelE/ParE family toxin [Sinorhizobium meliloti]